MDLVVRTIVIILFVFVLTRVVGRRELSTMEPFDVILLVVVGDLVQQGITQSDDSVTGATIVLATVGLLTVGLSYLSFKVPRLRPLLEGEPIVLVTDGKDDRPEPAPRAPDDRRPAGGGAHAADRIARRGALRSARDERQDQLPHEVVRSRERGVSRARRRR